MKKFLYIVLFLGLNLAVFGGNSDKIKLSSRTIAGKITDATGEAVAGAKFTIAETGETFFADLDGNFKLTVKTDKVYAITVNTIGYAPLTLSSGGLGAFSEVSVNSL